MKLSNLTYTSFWVYLRNIKCARKVVLKYILYTNRNKTNRSLGSVLSKMCTIQMDLMSRKVLPHHWQLKDKREPRESFSKPRPRNEQAEAEKCSPRFPFVH